MNSSGSDGSLRYAAETILGFLSRFEEQAGCIAPGADIEFLHRARVATRRLRAAFGLFAPLLPEGHDERDGIASVRRVTTALGRARDLDVQLEFLREKSEALGETDGKRRMPGIARLVLRKSQERERLGERVLGALRRWRGSGTPERVRERLRRAVMNPDARGNGDSPSGTPAAFALLAAQVDRELRVALSFDLFVRDPSAVTELHELRKATKRVRYMLEMLDPLFGGALSAPAARFRTLQDDLGAIHDCDVWIAELPGFLEAERERTIAYFGTPRPFARLVEGVEFLLDDRRKERSRLYASFVKTWERELADGLFGTTSDILNGRETVETKEATET